MSALSIVQTAASWLALPIPDELFSSTEPQVVQLRGLLNEEGYDLVTWPDKAWTKLTREKQFITVAADAQPGALAPDFSRFLDQSIWDRSQNRPVYGPMSPQQWEQEKASPTFSISYYGFRLRGNDFLMTPTPQAGDTIAYEYVSSFYVYDTAAGDTVPTKDAFTLDTDTSVFPETLVARRRALALPAGQGLPLRSGVFAMG